MERVRKAINIIGAFIATIGIVGFFVMAGCCVSLFFLGVWMSNVEFRQTRKKHRRTNG